MSDLLPCPFCGSDDIRVRDSGFASWFGHCEQCRAQGTESLTTDEAEAAWNRRSVQHIIVKNTVYRIEGDIEIASRSRPATGERVVLYVSATRTTEGPPCPG